MSLLIYAVEFLNLKLKITRLIYVLFIFKKLKLKFTAPVLVLKIWHSISRTSGSNSAMSAPHFEGLETTQRDRSSLKAPSKNILRKTKVDLSLPLANHSFDFGS